LAVTPGGHPLRRIFIFLNHMVSVRQCFDASILSYLLLSEPNSFSVGDALLFPQTFFKPSLVALSSL
jgi:hypothetical protein